jgi:hypothetical protein
MPCRIFISPIWQIAKAVCKFHKFVSHINLFKLRFTPSLVVIQITPVGLCEGLFERTPTL